MLISASLLAANPANLGEDTQKIDTAGSDWIHCDVFDGHFVPALSFGVNTVAALRSYTKKPLDVHLMVDTPLQYLPTLTHLQQQPPHNVRTTVHVEACADISQTIATIRATGTAVGLAIRLETPAEAVVPHLTEIDQVLVMTVRGGYGGDPFQNAMLPKIAHLRKAIDACGKPIELAVDGGVSLTTAPLLAQAGATVLCAGSSVFKGEDWAANIANLRKAAA